VIHDRPAALGNYRTGRKRKIDLLILHTMEGGFLPTAQWFADPEAHTSAHFGISVDGEIARYVLEHDTAWHAGHPDFNARSLGIELEGHASDKDAFTDKMLDALVELADDLCANWNIPRDRAHIIGHCEVPDPRHPGSFGGAHHHTDPGKFFPWDRLMDALTRSVA